MDRKKLQDLENKCIQEEAPACVAACPIHVDARAFLAKVALGAWDEAVQVLAVTMPLTGIVGRICDHPCQLRCRRAEAGGALAIGELERAALRRARTRKGSVSLLPPKDQRVAIVGAGLGGLSAAWDLLRKGYRVTVLADGERLRKPLRAFFPEEVLPDRVIEEEIGRLEEMGLETGPLEAAATETGVDALGEEFEAVYVDMDERSGIGPLGGLAQLHVDPVTLSTPKAGVFVGRKRGNGEPFSPIGSVAEGRRAATSIDRYLQTVSLTAGREREGPYQTRLYTSLAAVDPARPVQMEDRLSGYSDAEATLEAGRCIGCECMECARACLFLGRFKSFPKRYVRQISNDETMVMGSHGETIRLVNSCSLCGLCETLCPNNLSMASVCMEGRKSLVNRGKMAPSAHDFALAEMVSANSEKVSLALHEPGKEVSKYAFFPGCQMAAIYPEHVAAAYAYLRGHLEGGTGLILRCCGVPAEWAAREDLFADGLGAMREEWTRLGSPTIVAACPTCYRTFKKHAPDMKVVTLWQVLAESSGAGLPERQGPAGKVAVHDPCTSRREPEMHDSVRVLLRRLGYSIEELPLSRDKTECCGFGGLMSAASPSLAKDVALKRASESRLDYVTYCAMCRNALAASGKRISHVLDLCFPGPSPDPAARKAIGHSERSENRLRLKRALLGSLWMVGEGPTEEYETVELLIPDDVAARMEERRILREDVKRVIYHALETGDKLYNPVTGRCLASFRPALVTYWVEYSAEEPGFRVHNAYCHRMEVLEERWS